MPLAEPVTLRSSRLPFICSLFFIYLSILTSQTYQYLSIPTLNNSTIHIQTLYGHIQTLLYIFRPELPQVIFSPINHHIFTTKHLITCYYWYLFTPNFHQCYYIPEGHTNIASGLKQLWKEEHTDLSYESGYTLLSLDSWIIELSQYLVLLYLFYASFIILFTILLIHLYLPLDWANNLWMSVFTRGYVHF